MPLIIDNVSFEIELPPDTKKQILFPKTFFWKIFLNNFVDANPASPEVIIPLL